MIPVLDGIGIISNTSALIQWTVPSIAYTPETYVVEYGTSQDSLDMTSDPTHSGEDITIASVTYSVTLSDLRENTTYYVHIVATNTAGRSTTSSVQRFTTSLAESGALLLYFITLCFHRPNTCSLAFPAPQGNSHTGIDHAWASAIVKAKKCLILVYIGKTNRQRHMQETACRQKIV